MECYPLGLYSHISGFLLSGEETIVKSYLSDEEINKTNILDLYSSSLPYYLYYAKKQPHLTEYKYFCKFAIIHDKEYFFSSKTFQNIEKYWNLILAFYCQNQKLYQYFLTCKEIEDPLPDWLIVVLEFLKLLYYPNVSKESIDLMIKSIHDFRIYFPSIEYSSNDYYGRRQTAITEIMLNVIDNIYALENKFKCNWNGGHTPFPLQKLKLTPLKLKLMADFSRYPSDTIRDCIIYYLKWDKLDDMNLCFDYVKNIYPGARSYLKNQLGLKFIDILNLAIEMGKEKIIWDNPTFCTILPDVATHKTQFAKNKRKKLFDIEWNYQNFTALTIEKLVNYQKLKPSESSQLLFILMEVGNITAGLPLLNIIKDRYRITQPWRFNIYRHAMKHIYHGGKNDIIELLQKELPWALTSCEMKKLKRIFGDKKTILDFLEKQPLTDKPKPKATHPSLSAKAKIDELF